jgi:hypothetical protein
MKNLCKIIFIFVAAVSLFKPCSAQQAAYSQALMELNRISLEEQLEDRLKKRMVSFLEDKDIIVIVKIKLMGEKLSAQQSETEEYALPGVPVEKKLSEKVRGSANLKNLMGDKIANINAWIFIGREIPLDILDRARNLSSEILGLNAERGDILTIETYMRQGNIIGRLEKNRELLSWAVLTLGVFTGILFLFGTFRGFLKNLVRSLSSLKVPSETEAGVAAVNRAGNIQQAAAEREKRLSAGKKESLVDLIDETNIGDIVNILANDSAEKAVVVLGRVSDGLASKIFSSLAVENQREILSHLKKTTFMEPQAVEAMSENLKNKLKYVYGGSPRLTRLLQNCPKSTRESMLDWLRAEDGSLAGEIENNIIEFDDLMDYDDQSFRRIFREAGLGSFAQALKNLGEEKVAKFAAKLGPEVAGLLGEQINIMPSNDKRSEEARFRILGIADDLVGQGFIPPIK